MTHQLLPFDARDSSIEFREALDSFIERLEEDRQILAAVLVGSLEEEVMWRKQSIGLAYRGGKWEAFHKGNVTHADDPVDAIMKCVETHCPDALEDTTEPPPSIWAAFSNEHETLTARWWTFDGQSWRSGDKFARNVRAFELVPNKHQDMEQAREWLGVKPETEVENEYEPH